jgi:parafibromin
MLEQKLMRKLPTGGEKEYRVIDNPSKLTKDEWNSVVAVFATGQAWQFKDWLTPNPAELFQKTMGVHLMYDDSAVDAQIASWNCRVLKVSRSKRHLDVGASLEFWTAFDTFVKLHKPHLDYTHAHAK